MEKFNNILLIQLGDIGDVVLTTPTIRAIKETYPEARLSIMVRKPYGDLLLADPNIHEVLQFSKVQGSPLAVLRGYVRFISRLRRARYDLAIDLRTGDRGAFFTFFTGATQRIGYRGDDKKFWHGLLFTRIVRGLATVPLSDHPGANQSLSVLRSIGIDAKASSPHLFVAPNDRERAALLLAESGTVFDGRWLTVNPFSRWKYKEWDSEKWSLVIVRIWEKFGIHTVIIGSSEEAAAAERIAAKCKGHAINLAGKTTLAELAAVIATSKLHLGVDSAAPHIAAALGVPTITIHGPSDWRAWRIVDELHRVIVPVMACVPCNRKGCDDMEKSRCLDKLDVETVIRGIEDMLLTIPILR